MEQKMKIGSGADNGKMQEISIGSPQQQKSTRKMMQKLKDHNLINISTQIGMVQQLIADHFGVHCSMEAITEVKEEDYWEYIIETEKRRHYER